MDVFLAGSLEAPIYPLRARLGHMIEDKTIPGAFADPSAE